MEEKQNMSARWSNKANTIVIVLLFVGVFLYNMINPSDRVEVTVDDTDLILGGYEEITYRIPLDTIDSFTYVEEMEYPEESKSILCGTYSNEQWGQYILYVNGKVPACVVAEAESGTYMFNYESESTTKSLYEALLELL